MTKYSDTVRESTQKFLDEYTESLTKTAGALSDTAEKQSKAVKQLSDALEKSRS